MYFIHDIQTYTSVNRKGNELQEYILKLGGSLVKNRGVLEGLKDEIRQHIVRLDAKYPRTGPLHLSPHKGSWHIHVEGRPDMPVCVIPVTKVRRLLGNGSLSFPGKRKEGGAE